MPVSPIWVLRDDSVRVVTERYDYSPFGLTRTRVDAKPPAMGQVLLRDGRLRLEFDEPIQGDELRDAVGDGRLQLEEIFPDGTSEPVPLSSDTIFYDLRGRRLLRPLPRFIHGAHGPVSAVRGPGGVRRPHPGSHRKSTPW